MGQQQSRAEFLYNEAVKGNIIKVLCGKGVDLEWIDEEGKTPLIVACMSSDLFIVVKTLIEHGANVNAYCPGRHAGTPLHHAAGRGLHQTVNLLLSHRANPLVRNDDCQTPLDVARVKGSIVVRAIESHICYFSGWLREFYVSGILEASRKIWVVIIPRGPHDPTKPLKLELAIYPTLLDSRPRTVIALWSAHIEEPSFHQSDPGMIVFDKSTNTRHRFRSANDGDKEQLQWLLNACRGIPQVMPPFLLRNTQTSVPETTTQTITEAEQLVMVIRASIQSSIDDAPPLTNHLSSEANNANGWGNGTDDSSHNGWGSFGSIMPSEVRSSRWIDDLAKEEYHGWGVPESRYANYRSQYTQTRDNVPVLQTSNELPALAPSAPPLLEEELVEDSNYPSIGLSPMNFSPPSIEHEAPRTTETKDDSASSLCVICWEAPVEGACIPCGHMASCVPCLKEIKSEQGTCPVCRAKIDQVLRIYAV